MRTGLWQEEALDVRRRKEEVRLGTTSRRVLAHWAVECLLAFGQAGKNHFTPAEVQKTWQQGHHYSVPTTTTTSIPILQDYDWVLVVPENSSHSLVDLECADPEN